MRPHVDTLPAHSLIVECERCGQAALPGRGDDCPLQLEERIDVALAGVKAKLLGAMKCWPAMNSLHEGWGVLSEENAELFEIVRQKQHKRQIHQAVAECEDVAAMAVRIILDVCNEEAIRR